MRNEKHPSPGDLLEYRCPRFGIVWQWRIESICLGATNHESIIQVRSVHLSPGCGHDGLHETMWVPEPMTRAMTLVKVGEA